MILKASQRGGGKQLALHLLRTDENEHVETHEIRGFISQDLTGALKEAHAVSVTTRCKQFLFSVSLSPPPHERVPVETFESAIERIEQRTGLTGHPRVVVFHEKEGRRHAHAVWSRINADSMTAQNLPFFKNKMRDLSRELYLENGWKMPRGLMNSREADPRNFSLKEWQQSKRIGRDARDLKELMQECWAVSDSKAAFMQALKARGLSLAKGDRRAHVAITPEGEVLSVARYTGKKTKEIEKRLGAPDSLPSVQAAKAQLAKDLSANFLRLRREAEQQKRLDLAPLDQQRTSMVQAHRAERARLKAGQERRWAEETHARADRFEKGLKGLWGRLTGKHAEAQRQNEREAYAALARDRSQRQAVIDAQMRDRQTLQAQIKVVRDRHASLLKELRADQQAAKQIEKIESKGKASKTFTHEAQPTQPTMDDRIELLRKGERAPRRGRDRGMDRER
jgi:hypothetical protein